ncbi:MULTISPECIES: TetR family transcriptional regulator C-terminal domain-containing protein [unclassified Staphylococcus]|uniref:TetR/AcrR family transcriptional regulator n=1 Tax=unclassified Staphylococcus TaxID=91994 RepID=UPI00194ECE94|nr:MULTISPECIES: TetR family transcriptional regulator C-terminal domain-containing protein [unclassified Staphylococcus]
MTRNKDFDVESTLLKAMNVFWKYGYEKTSIQTLLDELGIHRKSMYDTFGGKHQLLVASVQRYQQKMNDYLSYEIHRSDSAQAQLKNIFLLVIKKEEFKKGCLFIKVATELSNHDSELRTMSERNIQKIEDIFFDIIIRGQKSGELSEEKDARILAQYLMNAWTGLRVLVQTTSDMHRLENIVDETLRSLAR